MGRQDGLPPIWGANWEPDFHLEFSSPLTVAEARSMMMAEVAQQQDGHLRVFAFIWDEMTTDVESWDGNEFHEFSSQLCERISGNLSRRSE